MFSFHLTGSPWFLLLLPPGLFILWRQYRGGAAMAFPGRLLFFLQAMALAIMVASLARPELRMHRVEFHNPAVLVLRDQSTSFQGGSYLGLGRRYAGFESALIEKYAALGFDIRFVDFDESARKASPGSGVREGRVRLTSIASLADYLDSASVPNLRAAFLFSDGIANLDSGRGSRSWKTPVYPVVFHPDSIAEVQPLRVSIVDADGEAGATKASARSRLSGIDAWWRPVGGAGEDAELALIQGGKTLMARKLAETPGGRLSGQEGGIRKFRFQAGLPINIGEGPEPVRAILRPAQAGRNFNTFNDTLDVSFSRGRTLRTIYVFRPIRGLDEKGMLDILSAWEGTRVVFFGMGDSARFSPAARDQVWVEAGAVAPGSRFQAWLAGKGAKVVLYVRPGPGRNLQVPGLVGSAWRIFSPAAEIRAGRHAAESFPADILRLKAMTSAPLAAPDAATGVDAWVEAREGGKRGMVMGRIPLGNGNRAFFFCLPEIWEPLFDPQGDFASRENIAAFIRSAHALAEREDASARVSLPGRVFDMVPFDIPVALPGRGDGAGRGITGDSSRLFAISGTGFFREWPLDSGGIGEAGIVKAALPAGAYSLELRSGASVLWRDSLNVAPKTALELARIGFDMDALSEAASRSGGALVAPASDDAASDPVTSVLPDLEAAQVRAEKTRVVPLYNTLFQFLMVILLLSVSWVLRKKWDID